MIKNYVPLIHGIIDALLFLENAGPEEVDDHSAVRCMENISASLHALDESDQKELRSHIEEIADQEPDPSASNAIRRIAVGLDLASL